MIRAAILFFGLALVALLFGLNGVAGLSMEIGKVIVLVFIAISATASADSRVGGYTTKRGTYVAPHHKSSPDSSRSNNFSTKGNLNPYTGKKGTVDSFKLPRMR